MVNQCKIVDSVSYTHLDVYKRQIQHISCESATLSTDPSAKLDIDGEILFETPVEIKILRDQVKLFYVDLNNA